MMQPGRKSPAPPNGDFSFQISLAPNNNPESCSPARAG
jgi:hypothetical protein